MAAARLIALHVNRVKGVSASMHEWIDYAHNPEKTENGTIISSNECQPETAAEEFLLSRRQYQEITGKHAFTVSTHTDKAHIHNHIIFNSIDLENTHKFRNFFSSGIALQRLSDIQCFEHGYNIIKKKPYTERTKRTVYPRGKHIAVKGRV